MSGIAAHGPPSARITTRAAESGAPSGPAKATAGCGPLSSKPTGPRRGYAGLLRPEAPAHRAAARGEARAVAGAHVLLTVVYHVLKDGRPYHNLGAAYFDRLKPGWLARHHLSRLAELGFDVQLEPLPAA